MCFFRRQYAKLDSPFLHSVFDSQFGNTLIDKTSHNFQINNVRCSSLDWEEGQGQCESFFFFRTRMSKVVFYFEKKLFEDWETNILLEI